MTSTGPTTDEGKAVVSQNSLQHGLRSTAILIPLVESEDDWNDHRARLLEDLKPVGYLEESLAHICAESLWRLRRVARAEFEAIRNDRYRDERHEHMVAAMDKILPKDYGARHLLAPHEPPPPESLPRDARLDVIMRYQTQQSRQFYQALHALEALQSRRNGQPTPLARVQFHAPP